MPEKEVANTSPGFCKTLGHACCPQQRSLLVWNHKARINVKSKNYDKIMISPRPPPEAGTSPDSLQPRDKLVSTSQSHVWFLSWFTTFTPWREKSTFLTVPVILLWTPQFRNLGELNLALKICFSIEGRFQEFGVPFPALADPGEGLVYTRQDEDELDHQQGARDDQRYHVGWRKTPLEGRGIKESPPAVHKGMGCAQDQGQIAQFGL